MDSLLQITKYTPAPSYFETLSKEYFESYLDGHYRNVNEPAIAFIKKETLNQNIYYLFT